MTDLFFFYGLLRRGEAGWDELGLGDVLQEVGPDIIAGTLYDLGAYPGAILTGTTPIHGFAYRLTDPAALARLDDYEGYDPRRPDASLYVRTTVRTLAASRLVQVYEYARDPRGRAILASGRWNA